MKQAQVIDHAHEGQKYSGRHLLMQAGETFRTQELIRVMSAVQDVLPDYMLPTFLPRLMQNRRPHQWKSWICAYRCEPSFVSVGSYTSPRNQQEEEICAIWQDVLGLQRVGNQ
ncbi:hypothetical protein KCP69_26735 (plasmid) [Salmonella enterica subsp. enterica]|nr:hypothetical protein KCP69_26735 [Salmonella enterica subsp. enterica]